MTNQLVNHNSTDYLQIVSLQVLLLLTNQLIVTNSLITNYSNNEQRFTRNDQVFLARFTHFLFTRFTHYAPIAHLPRRVRIITSRITISQAVKYS